ncbi:MAG: hypothetical protein ACFFA8_01325 [Promethearchaeota archaeon]
MARLKKENFFSSIMKKAVLIINNGVLNYGCHSICRPEFLHRVHPKITRIKSPIRH